MYKVLNLRGLGVSGKQNELIELALTYGFQAVEIDMADLVGRHDAMGKQFACQFLQSAKTDMGTFRLPIKLGGTDEVYEASIAKLDTMLDLASTLNAKVCYVEIVPNNESYSFQECFEAHQARLQALAERFAPHNIKIGLLLQASKSAPADGTFKFVQTAEEMVTLVKAVNHPNVGICLDTWEWALGGGTVAQLTEAGIADNVTEVRLADVCPEADRDNIKSSHRTALPANAAGSFSYEVMQAVVASGADLAVSVATDQSTFSGANRDKVVEAISKQLDLLIDGKDPVAVAQEEAAAAAAAAEAEAEEEAVAEAGAAN